MRIKSNQQEKKCSPDNLEKFKKSTHFHYSFFFLQCMRKQGLIKDYVENYLINALYKRITTSMPLIKYTVFYYEEY